MAPPYGELRGWLEMAFAARKPACPFIVSWKGEGIREVKTAWQKARVRAGVPELLIHDLRRTAARKMIRAGVLERQVLDIVGWKTRAMLDRYNIIDERDVHTAGARMEHYLQEQARLAEERTKERVRTPDEGEVTLKTAKHLLIQ